MPSWRHLQLGAVGAVPVARDRLAAEALLDHGDVVDGDDPAEPAAAGLGGGTDGLPEGRLVGGRVVQHLDDLEVVVLGQGEDDVARAEPGVHPAIDRRDADELGQPGGRGLEATGLCRIRDVVNSHTEHRDTRQGVLLTTPPPPLRGSSTRHMNET